MRPPIAPSPGAHACHPRRSLPRLAAPLIIPAALLALFAPAPVSQAAGRDSDGDNLTDRYERTVSHTNPHRDDTDNDGLRDRYEIRRSKSNPLKSDTDGDGLTDRYEWRRSHTNPRVRDTDRDLLTDRQELFPVGYLVSVKSALNLGSFAIKTPRTDPRRRDTDRDGLTDGYEVRQSLTNPIRRDTDTEGLGDGQEVLVTHTNPLSRDTDDDGISDYEEVRTGSDPRDPASTTLPPAATTPPVDPAPPVDTTAPDTSITSGPTGTVSSSAASFSVSATEAGSTFQCRLDGAAWSSCTSPKSYSGLADGTHTFDVRATDPAGNTDATPATRTWTINTVVVDTTAPDTSITSGPTGTVSSSAASFSVSATEAGSTFQCRLDGAAWSSCTSPKSYSGLADGTHTFDVRATDPAGNTDATPATRTWTINTDTPGGPCAIQTPNVPDGPDPWGGCFPGPANTGVPAGTTLTAYTGPSTVTTANTVITGKTIGCIRVRASGVTIRNSRIACPGGNGVMADDGAFTGTPLLIEDSEITCGDTPGSHAMGEARITARRVDISHCENGADINQEFIVEDSYIHDMYNSAASHTDGLQFAAHFENGQIVPGALNVTVRHNTIFGIGADGSFGTSAIITNVSSGGDTNILIDGNLLAGGAYTLYCPQTTGTNYRVTNNVFSRMFKSTVGYFGPSSGCSNETQSGNVYDNGQPASLG